MPRHSRDIVRTNITLPRSLMSEIQFYLSDPLKPDKLRYGSLSAITAKLWVQFLRELQTPGANPIEIMRRYGVDVGEDE